MTAEEAVKVIRDMAERGVLKTTVQRHFDERVREDVQCSPYEVEQDRSAYPSNPELWRCKPRAGGSYMKNSDRWVDKCCKAELVTVPRDIVLRAEGKDDDDRRWRVVGENSVQGEHLLSTWT
jgi:hypothetical protein